MHEIEPQSDARLREALRHLAISSPRSAPDELSVGLLAEFRRHYARRRRIRRAVMTSATFCLVLVAALAWFRPSHTTVHQPDARNVTSAASLALSPSATQNKTRAPGGVTVSGVQSAGRRRAVARNENTGAGSKTTDRVTNIAFLALPGYDPAVPMDQLNVVRVQLTESALWKMGAPVSADAGRRPVLADFVVSQDGTPFAVRLVQ